MKKVEMRERVSEWSRSISEFNLCKDTALHMLQEIAEENGIARYCSVEMLTVELAKAGVPSFKWFKYVEQYNMIEGEHKALTKFLEITDNFNL